jgi:hypothetical protein
MRYRPASPPLARGGSGTRCIRRDCRQPRRSRAPVPPLRGRQYQWFAEAHGATRVMPETLARSGLAPGEQDPVRRDDDGLHGEPGHLGVDPLELGLRQRGTGHNRQSRDSRAARRPRQSARPTVQAPGEAMTAAPHLWTPWGSNGRCIGSADREECGRAPARRVHHIRSTLVARSSCRYALYTCPSPFKTLASQAMRARRPCPGHGLGR